MALGDLLGGLLGGSAGKQDMKNATGLSQQALDQLKQLYVPTVAEQEVLLKNPELAGLLEAQQQGESELAGVSNDPRLKNAQMKALEEIAGLSQTGLGVDDQAAYNQLRRQSNASIQAALSSIDAQSLADGTYDSGSRERRQMQAIQDQANRLQQAGENQAAQAAAARRQALGQYANMSSNMANTDFNQKSTVASAKDAINKFNAQNRQDVNQYNLGNRQNIANTTAATANQQEMYNKGLIQQKFQNNVFKATGVASQANNLAGVMSGQGTAAAQGQADMTKSILEGGAKIAAAKYGAA